MIVLCTFVASACRGYVEGPRACARAMRVTNVLACTIAFSSCLQQPSLRPRSLTASHSGSLPHAGVVDEAKREVDGQAKPDDNSLREPGGVLWTLQRLLKSDRKACKRCFEVSQGLIVLLI